MDMTPEMMPDTSDNEEVTPPGFLSDPDWMMRRVAQIGLMCCMVLTTAMLIRFPRQLPFELPSLITWVCCAAGMLLVIPVWRYLEHSQPATNLIVAGVVLGCLMGQTYGRRPDPPRRDLQLEGILAQRCPDSTTQRQDLKTLCTQLESMQGAALAEELPRRLAAWSATAAELLEKLPPWNKNAANPFPTGWMTAKPLTLDRIHALRLSADELSQQYRRARDACEKAERAHRSELMALGLTDAQTKTALDCQEVGGRMRQVLNLRCLWTERLQTTLGFTAIHLDAIRLTPDGKGLQFARNSVETAFRDLMNHCTAVLEAEENLLRSFAEETSAGEKQKSNRAE